MVPFLSFSTNILPHNPIWNNIRLFILQSFDWLVGTFSSGIVASHFFIAVQLSAPGFLATCFKYCSRGLPTGFFRILLFQECLLQTLYAQLYALSTRYAQLYALSTRYAQLYALSTRYAQLYALSTRGVYFFKFLKTIFLLSPFEKLHHSLFYLSIWFLTFFSSTVFHMHLWPSLHFFPGYIFWSIKNNTPNTNCCNFLCRFQTTVIRKE